MNSGEPASELKAIKARRHQSSTISWKNLLLQDSEELHYFPEELAKVNRNYLNNLLYNMHCLTCPSNVRIKQWFIEYSLWNMEDLVILIRGKSNIYFSESGGRVSFLNSLWVLILLFVWIENLFLTLSLHCRPQCCF